MPTDRNYDEFVGDLAAATGREALSRLRPHEGQLVPAVLAAATVSAHWLLSDSPTKAEVAPAGLAGVLRANYERGQRFDRRPVSWTIGICALLLLWCFAEPGEREGAIAATGRALDANLADAARALSEVSPEGRLDPSGKSSVQVVRRAGELLWQGWPGELTGAPETDIYRLLILIERSGEFLAEQLASGAEQPPR